MLRPNAESYEPAHPGVSGVEAKSTEDGRLVLRFQDGSFKDPFIARYVSDGTIKMFAYLVLLYDPKPHPLLAVEEPENQLYPELLIELAEEFRDYARRGGQVFVSTHSPDFLNGAELDEILWLVKKDGFTTVRRASDSELLRALVAEGDLPGALWKQRLFEGTGLRQFDGRVDNHLADRYESQRPNPICSIRPLRATHRRKAAAVLRAARVGGGQSRHRRRRHCALSMGQKGRRW